MDAIVAGKEKILIVGGGLAGMFLCAALCKAGFQVSLVDQPAPKVASRVAAGLFNVITGKFSAKTWQAETFLDTLNGFFEHPSFQSLQKHLTYRTIYRPFQDIFEANEWTSKTADDRFRHLVQVQSSPITPDILHNPHGGIQIMPCGWLETVPFLVELLEILRASFQLQYFEGSFDYGNLNPDTGEVRGDLAAGVYDRIIFAEGVGSLRNPWFGFVPIEPLKGQVLAVDIPGFEPDYILSKKIFVIRREDGLFTVGSTYEKRFDHLEPTEEGIAEITGYLKNLIQLPFEVVGARASARPTTPNRKPVLGFHSTYPLLMIQNGMGTKGVLQSPWAANITLEILSGVRNEVPKETDVKRFEK